MGRPQGDQAIVDDVLLAKLSTAVASAASATLASARTVRIKADRTPVTDADEPSQDILMKPRGTLMPGLAVVSEELAIRPSRLGDVFALIDPRDGTKEFGAGLSEYPVTPAIIQAREPVVGIVAVPAEG